MSVYSEDLSRLRRPSPTPYPHFSPSASLPPQPHLPQERYSFGPPLGKGTFANWRCTEADRDEPALRAASPKATGATMLAEVGAR